MRQWIPIIMSWNLMSDEGSPVEIVNRTNNALESYNPRFNALFLKQPTLISLWSFRKKAESRHRLDRTLSLEESKNQKGKTSGSLPYQSPTSSSKRSIITSETSIPSPPPPAKKKQRARKAAAAEDTIEITHRSKHIMRSKAATSKRN
jgi:hypothetical protein